MLDAASAQEGETARALGMMDRLMRAMCVAEAEKGRDWWIVLVTSSNSFRTLGS